MTSLAPELLSILACPEDKGPLYYFEDLDVLFNHGCNACTRREGIPVMLIDEAQTSGDERGGTTAGPRRSRGHRADVFRAAPTRHRTGFLT